MEDLLTQMKYNITMSSDEYKEHNEVLCFYYGPLELALSIYIEGVSPCHVISTVSLNEGMKTG